MNKVDRHPLKFLIYLMITILGSLILVISIKYDTTSGLSYLGVLVMLLPLLISLFDDISYGTLLLLIINVVSINSIYNISAGTPVGFTDVQYNIFIYNQYYYNINHLSFSGNPSSDFVSMYLVYSFISSITGQSIVTLSMWLPVIMTLFTTITIFVLIKSISNDKIALTTAILYSFEYNVLLFGHEFRTQTIGVLFLLLFIFLIIQKRQLKFPLYIIFLISIILLSFTVGIYLLSILVVLFICRYICKLIDFQWVKIHQSIFLYISLYFAVFFSYLIYLSGSFNQILNLLMTLIETSVSETNFYAGYINPPIVQFFSYFIYGIGILSLIFLFRLSIKEKKQNQFIIIVIFSTFLLISLLSILLLPLSWKRSFIVGFILLSFSISFYLLHICNEFHYCNIIKGLCIIFIFSFIIITVMQYPNYVLDNSISSNQEYLKDNIVNWDTDYNQYNMVVFIEEKTNNDNVISFVNIELYTFLSVDNLVSSNEFISYEGPNATLMYNIIPNNSLLVIMDKFNGESYTYRDNYPDISDIMNYSSIYSNVDYIVFLS